MTAAHFGLIAGLLAAMCSAATGLLVRGVGARVRPISLNAWRCSIAAIIFVPIWLMWNSSGMPDIYGIAWIALAVTFSIVIGDTSYFFAIERLGVSKATPIAKSYPIFAVLFSYYVFGESLAGIKIVGVILAIAGTALMSRKPKDDAPVIAGTFSPILAKAHWPGVAFALGTALAWAIGAVSLKQSLTHADVITVSLVKTVIAALALWAIASQTEDLRANTLISDRKCLLLATATGVTLAGAALLSVYSIKYVGAGAASVYTGLAPLFAVPLGVVIFKERMTMLAALGSVLAIAGVVCVSLA